MREVARKAFEQDIGPSRVQASKTGAKLDLETEQTQGAGERRGSTSNKSISVVIPDLPGAPVFDAHGGEKRAASTTSLEKPIDAVPSQSSRSQQQCQRLPSGSSNPERPCDALLPHPSSRWLPERPTDDTSRPNSATRKSLSQGAGRVPSYRSSGSVRGQSESDGEDKDVVCKTRSRRKSVELLNVRRVVSSGNLTDVFKERERALTSNLSPHNEADRALAAQVADDCWGSSNDAETPLPLRAVRGSSFLKLWGAEQELQSSHFWPS